MKTFGRHFRVLAAAVVAAFALASPAAASPMQAASEGGCTGRWAVVPSPSPGTLGNRLADVLSLARDDAWAVGSQTSSVGGALHTTTLALHWDGDAWTEEPTDQSFDAGLAGVYAVGPTNIWAVGSTVDHEEITASSPLVEHYDGRSWSVVPSPHFDYANLLDVSGVSENDIWAVGMVRSPVAHMLVEHFDGNQWKLMRTPHIDTAFVSLEGVAAISAGDVWAVGSYLAPTFFDAMLSVHFDGAGWRIVPTPPPGPEGSELFDVAAVNDQVVWAVGRTTGDRGIQPLALQWDGSAWTSPAPAVGEGAQFNGVAAGRHGQMLAVGSRTDGQGVARTLTEVYRDQSWHVLRSANASTSDNELWSVAIGPGREAWAVGDYNPHQRGKTLIERICR